MNRLCFQLLVGLLCIGHLAIVNKAQAIIVKDLYQATIPVANQSAEERARAAGEGLMEVIYRLTGKKEIIENEVVDKGIKKADRYLQQFAYSQLEQQGGIEFEQPVDVIELKFGVNVVNRLIRSAGLPLWGSNRPSVLLWLGVEDKETLKHKILNEAVDHSAAPAFKYAAKLRGLPPLYPVLDLEDEINMTSEDLWELKEDKILQASSRYGADSVLAGRVYKTAKGSWFGQWKFFFQGKVFAFTGYAENINQYMLEAVNNIGPRLAASYAIVNQPTDNSGIVLKIFGVESAEDYAALSNYLNKLSAVRSAQVKKVSGSEALFDVKLRGNFQQFSNAVSLDPKISLIPNNTEEAQYSYNWRP